MKKSLAILMHGGISGGIESQGFPKIVQLVEGLSDHFDVRVYSLWPVEREYTQKKYQVFGPPRALRLKFFRWACFVTIIIIQHIKRRHHVLFSFWAFPVGLIGVLLGILFNVRSCVSVLGAETANLPEIKYGYLRKPLARRLVIWTCETADSLIAVSSYQVGILQRYGLKRNASVIPFGVDKRYFYPLFKKPSLPLKILHVANLTEVKDQETLIRSFQIVNKQVDAKLRIVGPDFLQGKVHGLVRQLNLENCVEFVPPVVHQNLISHFHWADAFMLTSLSEGQNNSITEAMMCGVLPVSTAVGSMVGSFGQDVGVVADCGDYESLGNSVVALYHQPEEWEKKRRAAFEWANSHDLNWTIGQLKALLSN